MFGQRFVPLLAGAYLFSRSGIGEAIRQFARCLAEQNVPRPGLGVNESQPVRLDFPPTQAAYLARPAFGQQDEPHRRCLYRHFAFKTTQDSAELREIVGAE